MDYIRVVATATYVFMQTFINNFFIDESDESDSDHFDEEMEMIPKGIPTRLENFVDNVIPAMNDEEFQSHFRVTRQAFNRLVVQIRNSLENPNPETEVGRRTIPAERQLYSVLWLLGTPDSYRSVGLMFDMGKSSLWASFYRVIKALNKIAPMVIRWPALERHCHISGDFLALAGLEGILGAIDGTYIPIKAPKENLQVYINRKCFRGITLQAICDAKLKYLDCFTGYPSSVSDIRIFRNSAIYERITNNPQVFFGQNQFIIGDKAYAVLDWCIPPYINRGNVTPVEVNFNIVHAKTRQVVERSFALLFGRFRRLKYLDMSRTDLIPATIIACCVLHNICLEFPDNFQQQYEEEGRAYVNGEIEDIGQNPQANIDEQYNGRNLRDRLARQVYGRNNK